MIEAPKVWDVEPVQGALIDADHLRELFEFQPDAWYYSNEYYTNQMGNPAFLKEI